MKSKSLLGLLLSVGLVQTVCAAPLSVVNRNGVPAQIAIMFDTGIQTYTIRGNADIAIPVTLGSTLQAFKFNFGSNPQSWIVKGLSYGMNEEAQVFITLFGQGAYTIESFDPRHDEDWMSRNDAAEEFHSEDI